VDERLVLDGGMHVLAYVWSGGWEEVMLAHHAIDNHGGYKIESVRGQASFVVTGFASAMLGIGGAG